jgi:hypothetical protein
LVKRVFVALLAVLVVALFAIWKVSRSNAPESAHDMNAIAPDRTPARAPSSTQNPRKPSVPVFDERPALRAKIEELEKEHEAEKRKKERECITSVSSNCPFLTPSQDVLREMARCGVVRADMPMPPSADSAEITGSPDEMTEVGRQFWQERSEQFKLLHREIVGKPQAPTDVGSLLEEIQRAIPVGVSDQIHRVVARERAGLASSPTPRELANRIAAERFWRLRLALGDDFEDLLARKVGAQRARTLRAERDGWPGKAVFTGQCDP